MKNPIEGEERVRLARNLEGRMHRLQASGVSSRATTTEEDRREDSF
jgi:hypothetical protein